MWLELIKLVAAVFGALKAIVEYRTQKAKASTAPPVEADHKETPNRER